MRSSILVAAIALAGHGVDAFTVPANVNAFSRPLALKPHAMHGRMATGMGPRMASTAVASTDKESIKKTILQIAAVTDRGQRLNTLVAPVYQVNFPDITIGEFCPSAGVDPHHRPRFTTAQGCVALAHQITYSSKPNPTSSLSPTTFHPLAREHKPFHTAEMGGNILTMHFPFRVATTLDSVLCRRSAIRWATWRKHCARCHTR